MWCVAAARCVLAPQARALPPRHTPQQVLVVLGGVQGARQLRKWVKSAQSEQKLLCNDLHAGRAARYRQGQPIAVDKVFLKRLLTILSM